MDIIHSIQNRFDLLCEELERKFEENPGFKN